MHSLVLAGNFRELSQDEMFDVNGGWICWNEVGRAAVEGSAAAVPGAVWGGWKGAAAGTFKLPVIGTVVGKKAGAAVGGTIGGLGGAATGALSSIAGQTWDAIWGR